MEEEKPQQQNLQSPAPSKSTTDAPAFDLADPLIFAQLYAQTKQKRTPGVAFELKYKEATICDFALKDFSKKGSDTSAKVTRDSGSVDPNYLYCYANDGKELTWAQFGQELSKYNKEEIHLMVKTMLRIMRVDSRGRALQSNSDGSKTKAFLIQVSKLEQKGKYPPIELLGQLIGAAACEAGRGHTGYLNVFATFNKVKLSSDKSSGMQPLALSSFITKELFPYSYDNSALDTTRHATGFRGSQEMILASSGKGKVNTYPGSNFEEINNRKLVWKKRYDAMVERDIKHLSSKESISGKRQEKHKDEIPKVQYDRKFTRHKDSIEEMSEKIPRVGSPNRQQHLSKVTPSKASVTSHISTNSQKKIEQPSSPYVPPQTDKQQPQSFQTPINNSQTTSIPPSPYGYPTTSQYKQHDPSAAAKPLDDVSSMNDALDSPLKIGKRLFAEDFEKDKKKTVKDDMSDNELDDQSHSFDYDSDESSYDEDPFNSSGILIPADDNDIAEQIIKLFEKCDEISTEIAKDRSPSMSSVSSLQEEVKEYLNKISDVPNNINFTVEDKTYTAAELRTALIEYDDNFHEYLIDQSKSYNM